MAQQLIKDITPNDTHYAGCLLVKAVSGNVAKNGNPFVSITFMDPSGTIPSKMWNTTIDQFPHKAGEIIELDAKIDYFQNEPQLIVNTYNALSTNDPRNRISYYLQSAPMSVTKMEGIIEETIQNISNPIYRDVAETFVNKTYNGNSFHEQPAAKSIHHAYYRGLMYHTVRMLQQATALLSVYGNPNINADLLYTGILIHDIGKIVELSGFLDTEYTTHGTLLGHIGIVDGWLVEYAVSNNHALDDEQIVLLRHMVLSHHGKLEYGSPIEPHIPEAELLHRIDDTDAKMTMFETELENTPQGELSKRIYGLGNRTVYNTPFGKDDTNE